MKQTLLCDPSIPKPKKLLDQIRDAIRMAVYLPVRSPINRSAKRDLPRAFDLIEAIL
jgi:hypothetical protein